MLHFKFSHTSQLGHTLIEKLIVFGIIIIVSAFLFSVFDPLSRLDEMNDSKRKEDLNKIKTALQAYYQDHGSYPASSNYYITRLDTTEINEIERSWIPYMDNVPYDNNSQKRYVYWVSDTGQSYLLYASLDRGGLDKEACFPDSNKNGTPCSGLQINNIPKDECSKGGKYICNFGISSSNLTP